jgi:hypothetical protein
MIQHRGLAEGRWKEMPFAEQMANIGSEVDRALHWRAKNNEAYSRKAFERALELTDLTLECGGGYPRLKEVARVREALVDFFDGKNEYQSTEAGWKKYFLYFNLAARRNC